MLNIDNGIIKKFLFENNLVIFAPLKCGTRWLEQNTNPIKVEDIKYLNFLEINTKNDMILIYRDIKEHFISALYTEYLWFNYIIDNNISNKNRIKIHPFQISEHNKIFIQKHKNINNLFTKLTTYGGHFIPTFWEDVYNSNINFKLINLKNLSSLFENKEIEYNNADFDFSNDYIKNIPSKDEVFTKLSIKQLNILENIIQKENYFLNKILKTK